MHWAWAAIATSVFALFFKEVEASCPRAALNDKICAGYGTCNRLNQCVCDDRHTGFDCSQARCPMGPAWFATARAKDVAHYDVECSNRGICDRQTGKCICMEDYTGSACQRLQCPNNCNEAGTCMSLRQLSAMFAVGTEPQYDYVWDAHAIYGCKCRKGYHGYDCSKRSCPRGDDPMTAGQANEMQILQCTGTGGFFYVYFNGQGVTVPFDATASQLEQRLRTLTTLSPVKVTYTAGALAPACNVLGANGIMIEFISEFGPQPAFKVFRSLRGVVTLTGGNVVAAAGGAILAGRTSVKGSKEWEVCSNRGWCDEVSGSCECFLTPMPGFRSSDGYGNVGIRGDCGAANDQNKYGGPIKACAGELACSGHGYCSGAPSYRCICETGWISGDCSIRNCPMGPTWFDVPTSSNTIHNQLAVCSNAGLCDKSTGQCQCYSPFSGDACDQLACPGDPACSNHGQCMTIRQASREADVADPSQLFEYGTDPNNALTYDADSILGCKCDPGYQGYDCSQRSCPVGDDPTTTDQVDEIQVVQCIATAGTFQLAYKMQVSPDVPFDASPSVLRDILMTSFGFEEVIVEYSNGQMACSSAATSPLNVIKLTFPLNFGSLPNLRPIFNILVSNAVTPALPLVVVADGTVLGGIMSQSGTKENAVCSNKGHCNFDVGKCVCMKGYASSDGRGGPGDRYDCGYILPKFRIDS